MEKLRIRGAKEYLIVFPDRKSHGSTYHKLQAYEGDVVEILVDEARKRGHRPEQCRLFKRITLPNWVRQK